ncbi:MAG: hypothetical protein ACF8XB_02230 [Planctomycetota bacterium JB042]
MTSRRVVSLGFLVGTGVVLLWGRAAAQHLPSPGAGFDRVLAMTKAAADDGDLPRAARLAMLARSRILVHPTGTPEEALLKAFDDLATDAAKRARLYVEAVEGLDLAAELGPVAEALDALAGPLATQVDALIGEGYREAAKFAMQPLWFLDPVGALARLERAEAIATADLAPEDGTVSAALRLAETMSRGTSGAAIASLETQSPKQKEVETLRRDTALKIEEVAAAAIEADRPWLAIDLAGCAPAVFALYPKRFESLLGDARAALAKERADRSRDVVSKHFRSGRKGLKAKSFAASGDTVRFPPPKGKPGLLVTRDPIEGDFGLATEFDADFANAPPGIVFAHRSDDDFHVAIVLAYQGRPAVKVERYVDGEPARVHWWDGPTGIDPAKKDPWPVRLERHGGAIWLRLGTSEWIEVDAKGEDLTGAVGFYLYEKAEGKRRAEATALELELYAD